MTVSRSHILPYPTIFGRELFGSTYGIIVRSHSRKGGKEHRGRSEERSSITLGVTARKGLRFIVGLPITIIAEGRPHANRQVE
jgi:hypothetical protein